MPRRALWLLACVFVARVAAGQTTDVANGRGLFQTRCADCHGIDAKGVHGPDLTVLFANGASDDSVVRTIRTGVPGTEMPASNAPDAEIRAVVAYLRSIAVAVPPAAAANPANISNGERIFASSCASCHRAGGR